MSDLLGEMTEAPFGAYPASALQAWMMRTGATLPPTRLGRRLSSALRSALKRISASPIDAVVLGQRMRLHPASNAGEKRLLISPQYFDPEELSLLERRITPDFSFVDIGANVGAYTLFVAKRAGPRARILAVEPHPTARARLVCNLALNALDQVVVAPVAISDRAGSLELHLDARNIGSTSARADHVGDPAGRSFSVPALPLLNVLQDHGFSRVDALKIDIEGVEDVALVPFLRDAPPSLWPRLIIVEDNRRTWGLDLFGALTRAGYHMQALASGNAVFERS